MDLNCIYTLLIHFIILVTHDSANKNLPYNSLVQFFSKTLYTVYGIKKLKQITYSTSIYTNNTN